MHIDADARLAAAAGGAARYFADAAGLEKDAVSNLQAAVILACAEAFEDTGKSKDNAGLEVTLTWRVDRIEVAVAHKGAPVPATPVHALQGIDEVEREARDGVVVTRLTKFIKQGAASR
jgi:hypothetical protein